MASTGTITQVIGSTFDARFPEDDLPEIYNALKERNPSLSKTTVYNTLETMHKQKLVDVLMISESERRYDLAHGSHHHFMCHVCGRILDIDIACPHCNRIINGEHQVDEVHGYFKGVCSECLTKEEKRQ